MKINRRANAINPVKLDAVHKRRVRKWVAALRSGDYRQGTGELHKRDSKGVDRFCCLGVACDIARKGRVKVPKEERPSPRGSTTILYGGYEGSLPADVADWLFGDAIPRGHYSDTPDDPALYKEEDGNVYSAADVNDNRTTFKTIADLIEARFLSL